MPENRIVIDDNLSVMRSMEPNSVDLIYLDPPFNSGRDFKGSDGAEFTDKWKDRVVVDSIVAAANGGLGHVFLGSLLLHGKAMRNYLVYMTVRLLEMKRLLRDTGSIYLHCDPTASHYLKLVMDGVFGAGNFRNEITWKRHSASNNAKRKFGNITDTILYYAFSGSVWNRIHVPRKEKELSAYRKDRSGRSYKLNDLTVPVGAESRKFEWRGAKPKGRRGWAHSKEELENLLDEGRIELGADCKAKLLGRVSYLDEIPLPSPQNLWDDISPLSNSSERTGYPTQKPLALLERIIKASSNEGDIVLDPFCGSGTTLVAADKLNRKWIGIDISRKAGEIIDQRLKKELGIFKTNYEIEFSPRRQDYGS